MTWNVEETRVLTTSFCQWIMETLMVTNLLGGEVTQMNKLTTEHLEDKSGEVHTSPFLFVTSAKHSCPDFYLVKNAEFLQENEISTSFTTSSCQSQTI